MRFCEIPGCVSPLLAKGLCEVHYARKRKHGDPLVVLPPAGGPQPGQCCAVCNHPDRASIEREVAQTARSYRDVGAARGLSVGQILAHSSKHTDTPPRGYRRCPVCWSAGRHRIDGAILAGRDSYRAIGEWSGFGRSTIQRHAAKCVGASGSRMPGPVGCLICAHEEADEIDAALRRPGRRPLSAIAARVGCSPNQVYHHAARHLDNEGYQAARAAAEVRRLALTRAAAAPIP